MSVPVPDRPVMLPRMGLDIGHGPWRDLGFRECEATKGYARGMQRNTTFSYMLSHNPARGFREDASRFSHRFDGKPGLESPGLRGVRFREGRRLFSFLFSGKPILTTRQGRDRG